MKKFFANIKSKLASMKNKAGGVILAGLYALFNTTIFPTLGTKIADMFNYKG